MCQVVDCDIPSETTFCPTCLTRIRADLFPGSRVSKRSIATCCHPGCYEPRPRMAHYCALHEDEAAPYD